MKKYLLVGVAAALLLAGCASTGVNVQEDQLSFLKPGVTTEAEVVSRLGQPTSRTRLSDGSVLIQYVHAEARMKAATFVPVVGMFAGGMDTKSNMVQFRFGPDGRLLESSSTTSAMETNNGGASIKP